MNKSTLETAINEAERFLVKAKKARAGYSWHDFAPPLASGYWRHEHQPDTAAAKRASMDLTRALADLRKVD